MSLGPPSNSFLTISTIFLIFSNSSEQAGERGARDLRARLELGSGEPLAGGWPARGPSSRERASPAQRVPAPRRFVNFLATFRAFC